IGFPIIKGKENIEVSLPQSQEKEILRLNDDQLIFIIRGTAMDRENKPLEYFNSFVRGDKVKFLTCLK
ncbi:TPA: UTRA domain-containing protein, partial [Enterococcus faecium]